MASRVRWAAMATGGLMQSASGARCPLQDMFYSPWGPIPASLAAAWLVAACQTLRADVVSQDQTAHGTNEQPCAACVRCGG